MQIRLSVDKYLKQQNLTAYKLAQETKGRVARGSVYALARGEQVKRVDLETLGEVMTALERMTGHKISVGDLLEEVVQSEPILETVMQPFDVLSFLQHAVQHKPSTLGLEQGQRVPEGSWSIEDQLEEMRGRVL